MNSPAERYARSRHQREFADLAAFTDLQPFGLDPFQVEACEYLEQGRSVLVAAPTGSGKTIVGEFAVFSALQHGGKCFYTTPIKALSNQKFHDLSARYGSENVGLLTGDNSLNGEAPIVVMTTEVLRNMLYAGSATLNGLRYVVMDEVHYLADRFRGAVWEEVIIHLRESVSLVSLSATVSNAEEFGDWLAEVRGDHVTIVEERRPVPLHQHVMVGKRLMPLFDDEGAVNRELERIAREDAQMARLAAVPGRGRKGGYGRSRHRSKYFTPYRRDVVTRLESQSLLPAIYFIFSRAGCDKAVQQCLDDDVVLTDRDQREEIDARIAGAVADMDDVDLTVLEFPRFAEALRRGFTAHHAGILPRFKELVEDLFSRGLVKVVFATETLALGINMPARSVVIERLTKWNGETHADLTPGEYTQLTGRAGRRGIDVEGHGVVLWSSGVDPKHVAGLASTRTYPLRSSFQPTYNMAVNLVDRVGRRTARELLEQSFAQFQADRAVVGLARQVRKSEEALAGYAESAACERGDFLEYQELRARQKELESESSKRRRRHRHGEIEDSLRTVKVGDVIHVHRGKFAGLAIVLDPPRHGHPDPRPLVLTTGRQSRRLAAMDFVAPVEPIDRLRVPKQFNVRNPQARRDLAARVKAQVDVPPKPRGGAEPAPGEDPQIAEVRAAIRAHPCHACPDREKHARWAERYTQLQRDTDRQRQKIEQRTNTVARRFDRVVSVLESLRYLDGDAVTPDGRRLQRIYGDLDVVASEALRRGLFEGLDPAEFVAVVSGLTFEARRPEQAPAPNFPTASTRATAAAMEELAREVADLERQHRLSPLRQVDFGFAEAASAWASGVELAEVIDISGLAAGDFVRAIRQLLDLVAQIADAAGPGAVRDTARHGANALLRGIIADSAV